MLNFFREGLYYIHMTFFRTLALRMETTNFSKNEVTIIFLKTYVVACIFSIVLLAISGGISEAVRYSFDWYLAYGKLFSVLILALILVLVLVVVGRFFLGLVGGLVEGLVLGMVGVVVGLFSGLLGGLVGGAVGGVVLGLFVGLVGGLTLGLMGGLVLGLVLGLVVGLFGGLVLVLVFWLDKGFMSGAYYLLVFTPTYFVFYFRPFYVLPHLLQYWRSGHTRNPFSLFQYSPVYWDQMIYMPSAIPAISVQSEHCGATSTLIFC